jgi:hypothetical protein
MQKFIETPDEKKRFGGPKHYSLICDTVGTPGFDYEEFVTPESDAV